MKVVQLQQGSAEWHAHRATHFNASDAPAMLGISVYESRTALIARLATGITPEVDDATQLRFNDGHRFEALARPLAEKIIGDELYPVVGTEGRLSASFDGITFDESAIFEHKTLNDTLRAVLVADGMTGAYLPEQYRAQMEQQLMVSAADRCLFMASRWNSNDELAEELHCWYESDQLMRERIMYGWTQLSIGLEEYKRKLSAGEIEQPKEMPKAEVIQSLPSVFVQATGMVTASNLSEFKEAATTFISAIKTELVDDQDFADAEATVKFCKQAEGNIDNVKQAITGQMSSVDDALRTLDYIAAQLRDKRLMLDKLVKSEKEERKLVLVREAGDKYAAHLNGLVVDARYLPMMPRVDFGATIKGLKSLASMQNALDTALANSKIEADAIARDINAKLAWCKENAAGHSALFPDLQALMDKPLEDFTLTITSRIEKEKADEAARLEVERTRMEAEAKVKAEREAAEKLDAEETRIRAEERAKMKDEVNAQENKVPSLGEVLHEDTPAPIAQEIALEIVRGRPTREAMEKVVASEFCVEVAVAMQWLREEFADVAA
jgi:putative phage-type endonuclease